MHSLKRLALAGFLICQTGAVSAQHDISRHVSPEAGPEMTVEAIVEMCSDAVAAADALESDAYSIYHNEFRWCLTDLRARIDEQTAALIGAAAISWLESDDPVIQMPAVLMLGATRYEAGFPVALELLESDDWRVGYGAALAMAGIAREDHIPALITALRNSETEQQFGALYDALLLAGGEPPFIEEERELYDSLSEADRQRALANLEEARDFLRMTLQTSDIRRHAQNEYWVGGFDVFGEPMAMELSPEGRPLTGCPGMVFEFDGQRRIELGDHRTANMTGRESVAFAGGQLSFEIDANPQYMGQFPGQVEWTAPDGRTHILAQRAIFHAETVNDEIALILGPGSGPSAGTLFVLEEGAEGRPILRRVFELPVTPFRFRRINDREFLAVSLFNAAVVFDTQGDFTMGRCFRGGEPDERGTKPQ